MAGPTKGDVMYALLALDAYIQHGTNDSLRTLSENNQEISGNIGGAVFERSSDRMEDSGKEKRLRGKKRKQQDSSDINPILPLSFNKGAHRHAPLPILQSPLFS
jgi:hypothetical protein